MHTKLQQYDVWINEINREFPKGLMGQVWEAKWSRIPSQCMPWYNRNHSFDLVNSLISEIASEDGKTMMELGCGDFPIYAKQAAQQGLHTWAIDISPTAIDLAKKNLPELADKIMYRAADVLELDTDGQAFDLIVDSCCFHLLDRVSDRLQFAKKINDLLTMDGRWITCLGSGEDVAPACDCLIKRSLMDIVSSIEPYLKIIRVESAWREIVNLDGKKHFWIMVSQKRRQPAKKMAQV